MVLVRNFRVFLKEFDSADSGRLFNVSLACPRKYTAPNKAHKDPNINSVPPIIKAFTPTGFQ